MAKFWIESPPCYCCGRLALTWLVAQSLASKPFDRALEYNAHALAQQVRIESDGRVGLTKPLAATEVLRTDDTD